MNTVFSYSSIQAQGQIWERSYWSNKYSFFNIKIENIEFVIPTEENSGHGPKRCKAYIFNMRTNKDQGFMKLKSMSSQKDSHCYAIVCGGDGTVMWVVTEMVKNGINVKNVPIGIVPLGTGNDFSRSLGWGG